MNAAQLQELRQRIPPLRGETLSFTYTGSEDEDIPRNFQSLVVAPGVTIIPKDAFSMVFSLKSVSLPEGLIEIGDDAFEQCQRLHTINFPSTLRVIGARAFKMCNSLSSIDLPDSLEEIGKEAFSYCGGIQCARIPPYVMKIDHCIFSSYHYSPGNVMVSVELSENVRELAEYGLNLNCLRNLALPADVNVSKLDCLHTLKKLFSSDEELVGALKSRFDKFPVHKLCYPHSYHSVHDTCNKISNAIKLEEDEKRDSGEERASKKAKTSNESPMLANQDCLGMTPLHILALSAVPVPELYMLILEHYPESLITKDKWGATPLIYAFWTYAPSAQFLIALQQDLFPDVPIDWHYIFETLTSDASTDSLQYAFSVYRDLSPMHDHIEWESLLQSLAVEFAWKPDGLLEFQIALNLFVWNNGKRKS
jgi:hypothetical protein